MERVHSPVFISLNDEVRKVECKECGQKLSSKSLKRHKRRAHERDKINDSSVQSNRGGKNLFTESLPRRMRMYCLYYKGCKLLRTFSCFHESNWITVGCNKSSCRGKVFGAGKRRKSGPLTVFSFCIGKKGLVWRFCKNVNLDSMAQLAVFPHN